MNYSLNGFGQLALEICQVGGYLFFSSELLFELGYDVVLVEIEGGQKQILEAIVEIGTTTSHTTRE